MNATENTGDDGIGHGDFELLRQLEAGPPTEDAVDELWARSHLLLGDLGNALFARHGHRADLWPEGAGDDGDRGPFLWGRLKRIGNERFATHIGVFVSPGLCNLSIDLEKDLLDAGQAPESLEQVVAFYRTRLAAILAEPGGLGASAAPMRTDLRVWTDSRNVVEASNFGAIDFAAFMDANQDAGHPWPKLGYIMSADEVVGFGDRWVDEYSVRGERLVVAYDAMIESFRATAA